MEYNSFMEALKGKQHKIDKNKNGEVDAQDFKLLRKEESEESLDEIHRMKTKFNKLDPVSAKSVARQKLSNLVKSGHGKGALIANKMRTLNMGDEVDQEDLDALHEVLSKDAEAGDWIHDFVHSTNPKFEGKTKKERIKMALGAYYATQKKKDGISEQAPVAPVPPGGFVVKYHNEKGEHASTSKMFYDKNSANIHANKGNAVDKVGGKYTVHAVNSKGHEMKEETVVEGRNEGDVPFDKPYKTVTTPVVKDKSGATHTPMSRARNLARMALKKMQNNKVNEAAYAGLEKEDKPGKIKTALVKTHPNAVGGDTVEGWKDSKAAVKEQVELDEAGVRRGLHGEPEFVGIPGPAKGTKPSSKAITKGSDREYYKSPGLGGTTVTKWRKKVAEEVQKADIPAYLRKAKGDTPLKMDDLKRKDTISDPENLARNRGVKESYDEEGNVTSNQITYKEFAMMLEYETVNGKYVHKGTYGGSYNDPEGADDADEKKPKQQPAEKRGRGRPAGAKSGARKITGTSKLFK